MRAPLRLAAISAIAALTFTSPAAAQTYSSCNPTQQSGCPADPALGSSTTVDFTNGASDAFTTQGSVTYDSNGAGFTVAKSGDSPTLSSNWYIMFGKMSVTMKAAPGTGIVSSVVLQSDDLDEIDWEFLGGSGDAVQSNYWGKGQTTSFDRVAYHSVANTQGEFHTYDIEWTENQIIWTIDKTTVRVLNAGDANGMFPQTPMMVKLGIWAGGDSSNNQGTIEWAGGATDYSSGPYTMYVSSVSVVDYSTGNSYTYGDQSGTWESIESEGGEINDNSGGSVTVTAAPAITSTSGGGEAWDGTHNTHTATVSYTTLPGLPSGWTISGSGKVVPPSAAPATSPSAPSTPSPSVSAAASCSGSGSKVVTSYDDRGFLTTATIPDGISTGWDDRGFPTTFFPANCMGISALQRPTAAGEALKQVMVTSTTTGSGFLLATADPSALITAHISKTSDARQLAAWLAAFCTVSIASAVAFILA